MPEPWEDPAQPPETADGNLPLAGLLAELLASADLPPAGPPAEDESWMDAGAGAPPEGSGSGAALDPEAALRALDDSGRQYREAEEPQPAANPLLARLLADEPPVGELFLPDAEAAVSGPVGQGSCAGAAEMASAVADEDRTGPQVSPPDAISGPNPDPPATPVQPSLPVPPRRESHADTASFAGEQEPALLSSPAGLDETPVTAPLASFLPAAAEPAGGGAWPVGAGAQPRDPAPEPAWSGAAAEIRMPAESAADLPPQPPAPGSPSVNDPGDAPVPAAETVATAEPEPAPRPPEPSPAAAPVLSLVASHAAGGAADEDEFELVDAETAGRMLDRLLDAARTAIQSSLAPVLPPEPAAALAAPPEAGEGPTAHTPPEGCAADLPPAAAPEANQAFRPDPGGDQQAQRPPRREGLEAASRPGRKGLREDSLQEVSPLPPAAALLAMGLPERLRARLEALGDVEQVLSLRAATAPEAAPVRQRRLLVFRIGADCYGLPMECVREVERVGKVTPVPGAPAFVRGLVNLRGEILPLIDLRLLLGAGAAEPSASPRLIVAQAAREEPPLALMVDELNGLAPFEGELSGEGAHEEGLPPYVRGSIGHRGRRAWRLDAAAVFGLAALERLAEKT